MKGLRKHPGEKHIFWDREATNENLLDQANWIINQKSGKGWNKKRKDDKRKNMTTEELRWLYAATYENMVQQGLKPAPGTRKVDPDSRGEHETHDQEVLEDLWIKPEDSYLQWQMHKLSREETPTSKGVEDV